MKISNFSRENLLSNESAVRLLSFSVLFSMFFSAIGIQFFNIINSSNLFKDIDRSISLFLLSCGFIFSTWFFGIASKKLVVKYMTSKRFLKVSDLGLVAGISGYLILFTMSFGFPILSESEKSEIDAVSIFVGGSCFLMSILIRLRDKRSSVYKNVLLRRVKISFFNENTLYANVKEKAYRKIVNHVGNGFLGISLLIVSLYIFF